MSDLDRFELFVLVAQLGSVSATARELGLSKASISKQIKQLEEKFSIDLFSRSKQRLQLTPEGEVLLEQCQRLQHELENARNLCHGLNSEPSGKLHVVAFPYFAKKLIFPKLKNFLEQYPKIRLQIDITERVPNFIGKQVDLALGFSLPVPNPHEVIQRRMATTRYLLCATPGYFKEHGKPESLDELYQHHYIEHASRLTNNSLKLKSGCQFSVRPYLVLNSVSAMIECALQSLGLIQLPLYMLDDLVKQGKLIEVLSPYQLSNASVFYHYPKVRHMQPKVRKFIDYFLE